MLVTCSAHLVLLVLTALTIFRTDIQRAVPSNVCRCIQIFNMQYPRTSVAVYRYSTCSTLERLSLYPDIQRAVPSNVCRCTQKLSSAYRSQTPTSCNFGWSRTWCTKFLFVYIWYIH
jgi:aerobic-type carbon monoxide dehydrogenase small subunit (CoxS/CutS family)